MQFETHSLQNYSFEIGVGLPGLCAALVAAPRSDKVALVHERSLFGGNNSSEVRVVDSGPIASNLWFAGTRLFHELLLEDRAKNHGQFFD